MVPKVTRGGASFKDVAAYCLHDKEALSADRVAWTETMNLITRDPKKAAKVMAATAMAHIELKAAAGIKTRGQMLEKPVYVYSLSWHPDERPDRATMVEAASDSLKALSLEDRQALIVCHTDQPHAHVHVIVNRVSMEDGRAANMHGDHLKLSRWAEDWERRHGTIWCAERVRNNERRNRGERVRDGTSGPRSVFEAIRDATKGLNDNREARQATVELKADQQKRAAELTTQGHKMHQAYREELAGLAADYRRDKARIIEAGREERRQLREQARAVFQQTRADLSARQREERQKVIWRERSLLGRAWNAFDTGRRAKSMGGLIRSALWASVSKDARFAALRQRQAEERRSAFAKLDAETKSREVKVNAGIEHRLGHNYQRYLAARSGMEHGYETAKQNYAAKWAERTQAQREAWQKHGEKWARLERTRQLHERQKESLRKIEEHFQRQKEARQITIRSRAHEFER